MVCHIRFVVTHPQMKGINLATLHGHTPQKLVVCLARLIQKRSSCLILVRQFLAHDRICFFLRNAGSAGVVDGKWLIPSFSQDLNGMRSVRVPLGWKDLLEMLRVTLISEEKATP